MSSGLHFIGGRWVSGGGAEFSSLNPSTLNCVWRGNSAGPDEIEAAIREARSAQPEWEALAPGRRFELLRRFAEILDKKPERLAGVISIETGKIRSEALGEVRAMIGKAELTRRAYEVRCAEFTSGTTTTRFRAHGVLAVLGPFNFPGHLPNGHIMPALLAGNAVIFKPSDYAPLVAQTILEIWQDAGLPAGVLQLLQGGVETAKPLAAHAGIDGLFFTGSSTAGIALSTLFAQTPGRILALEMGGNNPLVVHGEVDSEMAATMILESAFLSGGQRCNAARRLIVTHDAPRGLEHVLIDGALKIRPGLPDADPAPFYGPLISPPAVEAFFQKQESLRVAGARCLLEGKPLPELGPCFVSPAIWDVTGLPPMPDEELFGPLLLIRYSASFEEALAEANRTRYGLVAGLLSPSREAWERFSRTVRAGVLNWNTPTNFATGAAPFGGFGLSGNHRPSAFFAIDSCVRPIACTEQPDLPS